MDYHKLTHVRIKDCILRQLILVIKINDLGNFNDINNWLFLLMRKKYFQTLLYLNYYFINVKKVGQAKKRVHI
jgi:hypothetical protein